MTDEHPKTEQAHKDNTDLPRSFVSDILKAKDEPSESFDLDELGD